MMLYPLSSALCPDISSVALSEIRGEGGESSGILSVPVFKTQISSLGFSPALGSVLQERQRVFLCFLS